MKKIWSIRPQDKSAKNWRPDLIGAAVLQFEWIAQGFTVVSFWTAPNRPLAINRSSSSGLEDRLRFRRDSDRPDGVPIGV
jgi:hypothetical protein